MGFALKMLFASTDYKHTPEERCWRHAESAHIFYLEISLLWKRERRLQGPLWPPDLICSFIVC